MLKKYIPLTLSVLFSLSAQTLNAAQTLPNFTEAQLRVLETLKAPEGQTALGAFAKTANTFLGKSFLALLKGDQAAFLENLGSELQKSYEAKADYDTLVADFKARTKEQTLDQSLKLGLAFKAATEDSETFVVTVLVTYITLNPEDTENATVYQAVVEKEVKVSKAPSSADILAGIAAEGGLKVTNWRNEKVKTAEFFQGQQGEEEAPQGVKPPTTATPKE